MARTLPPHCAGRAVWRAAALFLIFSLLLSPSAAFSAPAGRQQGLCSLLPAGSFVEDDTPGHCIVQYQESDGPYYALELSLYSSPEQAYDFLSPNPFDCAVGASGWANCFPLDVGDEAPPAYGNSYKGVTYSQLSSSDTAAAWRRGCYLLKGTTWYAATLKDKMMQDLLKVDAQLTTSACPGCADPNACQGTGAVSGGSGTGAGGSGAGSSGAGSSVCGAGVAAPAGPFAVSGYGCQYEEAVDGVTCQAAVVNACPDADLWYKWSIDGAPYPGYILDVFDPTQLGLCAGQHTVTVTAEDYKNNLTAAGISWTFQSTQGPPCGGSSGGAAGDPGAGSIRVDTSSGGSTTLPGPSGTKSTALSIAKSKWAKVFALCPKMYEAALFVIAFDDGMLTSPDRTGTSVADLILASVLLDCLKMAKPAQPALALVGSMAGMELAQTAPEDLPAQFRVDMLDGPARFTVDSDQVLIDVQTSEASIRSAGKNTFAVAFDGQTGDTTVVVHSGTVEVYSMGSALHLAALRAGQQVTVSRGQVSEVTRTPGDSEGSRSLFIGLGCLAGMVLAAALVVWALVRSRRKQPAARTAAADATRPAPVQTPRHDPPPSLEVTPTAGPRLEVAAGRASPAWVPLSVGVVTIGRDPLCTLVVDDPLVSSRHAQVSLEGRFWVVQDLGSGSGTFLAGVRIQRQALRPGDRIQVGRTVLQFLA